MSLPKPWKDETSFSKSDKDHTPRTWCAKFGGFSLILTRHIHYTPDEWVASCCGVFENKVMASKEVYDAAAEAVATLQFKLKAAIGEIHDYT